MNVHLSRLEPHILRCVGATYRLLGVDHWMNDSSIQIGLSNLIDQSHEGVGTVSDRCLEEGNVGYNWTVSLMTEGTYEGYVGLAMDVGCMDLSHPLRVKPSDDSTMVEQIVEAVEGYKP